MQKSAQKRRKLRYDDDTSFARARPRIDGDFGQEDEDFWTDQSFYANATYTNSIPPVANAFSHQPEAVHGASAGLESVSLDSTPYPSTLAGHNIWDQYDDLDNWLNDVFPSSAVGLPIRGSKKASLDLANPFSDGLAIRHPKLRETTDLPQGGGVNGYVKFRLRAADFDGSAPPMSHNVFNKTTLGVHHRTVPENPFQSIPLLPPDFGKGLKLDAMDSKLLKFYLVAFCEGRTLLPETNFWLVSYAPIAAGNECAKHALLALAGSYVLDYAGNEKLLARTNHHYRRAVELLNEALQDPEQQEVGKDDGLLSAIVLMLIEDLVNWELRKPKGCVARWQDAAEIAKKILDNTDPGYRYWEKRNVQCSAARTANANWVAFVGILAQPVSMLKLEDTDRLYAWLLEGTEREIRKIHGGTGLSPKLLHTYAQITHLCARLQKTPDSLVLPHGAAKIEERLVQFRQWSSRSEGYPSSTALLNACELDDEGKVTCPIKVTELTAETWVATAQIYLQCRFFRRPRSHPLVQERLDVLLRCVDRLPFKGPLFTSQAPFFPIVMMALVSVQERQRKVARTFFETTVESSGCRSSVPPVWQAVKKMWDWMDAELVEKPYDDDEPIGQRVPWWEYMITQLVKFAGVISLV